MSKGIYLVANFKSQDFCENLIFSIRSSGCVLPIRLIHFGGKKVNSTYILGEVEFMEISDFSEEANLFIKNLRTVLECPDGYLNRYLAWFGDWEEFIYSDNDIVALTNWDRLFDFLPGHDLVHADLEYTTKGKFNYYQPDFVDKHFGDLSLESAFTAGHFVARKDKKLIDDISKAVEWFKDFSDVPKKHDQSLLHIASLIGKWKLLNLCKSPNNWLSSWAGDYKNTLALLNKIQNYPTINYISHIHYSGRTPDGSQPIEDLLFSNLKLNDRLIRLTKIGLQKVSGIRYLLLKRKRLFQYIKVFI